MPNHALVIGNSDGIGLALTRRLLALVYRVIGISKSSSAIDHPGYHHFVQDVAGADTAHSCKASFPRTQGRVSASIARVFAPSRTLRISVSKLAYSRPLSWLPCSPPHPLWGI